MYKGLLEKYKEYLPVTDKTPMISLAEGNTPLIPLPNLSKELGGYFIRKIRRLKSNRFF